jgi:hypothetical protein
MVIQEIQQEVTMVTIQRKDTTETSGHPTSFQTTIEYMIYQVMYENML